MTYKEYFKLLGKDFDRYCNQNYPRSYILTNPSLILTFWFRTASYFSSKNNIFIKLLDVPIRLIYKGLELLTGIQIPIGAEIQGEIRFIHFSSIVISQSAIIGENYTFLQGVTIGRTFSGRKAGVPVFADHVVAFAGAKIIGNVKIGSHVIIGANAIVIDDVPDNCVVAGIPAKIVSRNSFECFGHERWKKEYAFM